MTSSSYSAFDYLVPNRDYRAFELSSQLNRVSQSSPFPTEVLESAQRFVTGALVISLHDHLTVYPAEPSQFFEYDDLDRQFTGYRGLAASHMNAVVNTVAASKWDAVVRKIGLLSCDVAHSDTAFLASTTADIERAVVSGDSAMFIGLEAGTAIGRSIARVEMLFGFGVRVMGIADVHSNLLGSGCLDSTDSGLSRFGRAVVERMNRVGLAIDVSHSSDRTCLDVFAASDRPVLLSHTGARAIWPSARLATDDVLRECAATGGLIGIYMPPNSTISRAHRAHSIDSVLDHVVHCAELVGVEHVAFGPDTLFGDHVALHGLMPNVFARIPEHESVPFTAGLENPAETFPTLVAGLFGRGFSSEEILRLIGGNAMRVLSVIFSRG